MECFDAIAGCLLGGALGDAFGGPYEGQRRPTVRPFEPATAAFSDDTQLSLATCEAIVQANGRVVPEEIAAVLLQWYREGRLTGLGASTTKALRELEAGAHWALAGRRGENAAGNGAAMRAAPLAFVLDPREAAARQLIRDATWITHKNDEAYAGALAVAIVVRCAISGEHATDGLDAVAEAIFDSVTRDRLRELARRPEQSLQSAAAATGTSGYTADTVPLALFAARQFASDNFLAKMAELVGCGGDTDTIASIAGQCAGARLGLAALPPAARQLPGADAILRLARRLAELDSVGGR